MKYLPEELQKAIKDENRLKTLAKHILRPAEADSDFDTLTAAAAHRLGAPCAFICIVDFDGNWVQASHGVEPTDAPVDKGLCAYPIAEDAGPVFVVVDPAKDDRFSASVPAIGGKPAAFFAGAAIRVHGVKVGTLCIIDTERHAQPAAADMEALGALAAMAGSLFELKDAARGKASSELALSRAETRHSLALRAANIAAWSLDIASNAIKCDNLFREMFNLPVGEPVTGERALAAVEPEQAAKIRMALGETLGKGEEYQGEIRVRSTGRWLLAMGRGYEYDAAGKPLSVIGVVVDITPTKQSEEKTRLLLRELNHRVKNTLAILQSLASQTLRRSQSAAEFTMSFSGRLQALSAAHTLLSDQEWGAIDIVTLLKTQITPYSSSFDGDVCIHGDHAALGPDEALGLGLVIHELATNAAKYGALSVRGGCVDIAITLESKGNENALVLDWAESGGPPVKAPDHRGFGSILITRSLDKIVGSSVDLDFPSEGTRAHIRIPLRDN